MNCWPCEPGADLRCGQGFSAREASSSPSLAKKYYLFHTESIVSGDEKDPAGLLWHSSRRASQFGASQSLDGKQGILLSYCISADCTCNIPCSQQINQHVQGRNAMRMTTPPLFFLPHLFARTHSEIFAALFRAVVWATSPCLDALSRKQRWQKKKKKICSAEIFRISICLVGTRKK